MHRRTFVYGSLAAGLASSAFVRRAAALAGSTKKLHFAEPTLFDFDLLIERARALAAAPYQAPPRPAPDLVAQIGYDAHGRLQWKRDHALFADGAQTPFPVTFFHLGQ